jgi:hypothetical protein
LGGRLLQQTGRSGSSMDNPFADIGFYSFAGLGLGLMIGIFCGLRSICWPDIDARNDASEDEIVLAGQVIESTLAQRKRTILELFRTSQVTMVSNGMQNRHMCVYFLAKLTNSLSI